MNMKFLSTFLCLALAAIHCKAASAVPYWYSSTCACGNPKQPKPDGTRTYYERCGRYCKGIRIQPKENPTCACGDKKPKPKSDGTYSKHCSNACVLMRWGVFPEHSWKPQSMLNMGDLKTVVAMIESLNGECWNVWRPVLPGDWSLKIQPNPNHGCVAYSVCFEVGKRQPICIVRDITQKGHHSNSAQAPQAQPKPYAPAQQPAVVAPPQFGGATQSQKKASTLPNRSMHYPQDLWTQMPQGQYCKGSGCKHTVSPPKNGKFYNTCCRECTQQKGHSSECYTRNGKTQCSQSWCKRPANKGYPDCCHKCKFGQHAYSYCKSC